MLLEKLENTKMHNEYKKRKLELEAFSDFSSYAYCRQSKRGQGRLGNKSNSHLPKVWLFETKHELATHTILRLISNQR